MTSGVSKSSLQFVQPKAVYDVKFEELIELSLNDSDKVISNFEQFSNIDSDFNCDMFRKVTKRMNKEEQRSLYDVILSQKFIGCCGYVNINKIDREALLIFILNEEYKREIPSVFERLLQDTDKMHAMLHCKRILCKIDKNGPGMQDILALLLQSGFYRSATSQTIVTAVLELDQRPRGCKSSGSADSNLDSVSVSSLGSRRLSTEIDNLTEAVGLLPAPMSASSSQSTMDGVPAATATPQRSFLRREVWPPVPSTMSSLNQPVVFPAPAGLVPPSVSVSGGSISSTHGTEQAPCKYFPQGICMFGDNCKFRHDRTGVKSHDSITEKAELDMSEPTMAALPSGGEMGSSLVQPFLPPPAAPPPMFPAPVMPYTMYPTTPTLPSRPLMFNTPPMQQHPTVPQYVGYNGVPTSPAAVVNTLKTLALSTSRPTAQESSFLAFINIAPQPWVSSIIHESRLLNCCSWLESSFYKSLSTLQDLPSL